MPRKQHSEEQIIQILREANSGKTVDEVCREHGITRNTYYRWRKIYGGLDADQARGQCPESFTCSWGKDGRRRSCQ